MPHLKHLRLKIRTNGGMSLRSIFVAPTTLSSARLIDSLVISQAYHLSPSFAVPELLKTKGQVVVLVSGASQIRCPNASEYCTSKHAMLRFAEFVKIGKYYCSLPFVLDANSSSLCRVPRHQGLRCRPGFHQDGHVRYVRRPYST